MASYSTCLEKQQAIKTAFQQCISPEERYNKIIEFGRKLPRLKPEFKTEDRLVKGCQSLMYLKTDYKDGLLYFEADSDALISAGLAAILIAVYSGETPETVITCPPLYIEELGIDASLTPSRANGLYSVHLRMKQEAIKFLI